MPIKKIKGTEEELERKALAYGSISSIKLDEIKDYRKGVATFPPGALPKEAYCCHIENLDMGTCTHGNCYFLQPRGFGHQYRFKPVKKWFRKPYLEVPEKKWEGPTIGPPILLDKQSELVCIR